MVGVVPRRIDAPHEVAAIRQQLKRLLETTDDQGRKVGSAKYGVYAFYDYDGEPIYVGQTREKLGGRIGRHLTGARSDAVAKSVLDPFEVAEVELWPLWGLVGHKATDPAVKAHVNAAEYTVYAKVIDESRFGAVLNEGPIPESDLIELPDSVRGSIIPADVFERRNHADIRIARRALTIANLARVISERELREPSGLRGVLLTQARRLEWLAARRQRDVHDAYPGQAAVADENDDA
jgi:hypothetical protein